MMVCDGTSGGSNKGDNFASCEPDTFLFFLFIYFGERLPRDSKSSRTSDVILRPKNFVCVRACDCWLSCFLFVCFVCFVKAP